MDDGWLVAHEEVDPAAVAPVLACKVLRLESIPLISYPYEWSFSQFKDAALQTLAIQRRAIEHGPSLTDRTAHNVQFQGGRPIFIDALSFEEQREGRPWGAYRQFFQHFLAPLSLMSWVDVWLGRRTRTNIDGVPLDLASRLLPLRTKHRQGLAIHIHLHAKLQALNAERQEGTARFSPRRFDRRALLELVDHLDSNIRRLRWESEGTQWAAYYHDNSYTEESLTRKEEIVSPDYSDRIQ